MKNRQGRTSVQKDPRERDGRVVGLDIDVIIRTRMVNSNYNVQLLLIDLRLPTIVCSSER